MAENPTDHLNTKKKQNVFKKYAWLYLDSSSSYFRLKSKLIQAMFRLYLLAVISVYLVSFNLKFVLITIVFKYIPNIWIIKRDILCWKDVLWKHLFGLLLGKPTSLSGSMYNAYIISKSFQNALLLPKSSRERCLKSSLAFKNTLI